MSKTSIVFYENSVDFNVVSSNLNLNQNNWIFIDIQEFKEKKSTSQRFYENELLSISIFKYVIDRIKVFKNLTERIFKNGKIPQEAPLNAVLFNQDNIKLSQLIEYITPEIYEMTDSLAVKIFNRIRDIAIIKERFLFDNINIYEINRLHFVQYYNRALINLFSIKRLIEVEKPDNIYILSPIKSVNSLIIHNIAKINKLKVLKLSKSPEIIKRSLPRKLLGNFRFIFERIWYWSIWKILNKRNTSTKKLNGRQKNFVFAHYRNHYSSLIPLLTELQDSQSILNILYVPHKLFNYANEQINETNLRNVKTLPFSFERYAAFRKRYLLLTKLLLDIKNSRSFDEIEFESINFTNFIKISFLNLHEKLVQSLQYLENVKRVFEELKPDINCMLNGNDPIDLLGTQLSIRYKIPTLFFPHGINTISNEYEKFIQDHIVCAGIKQKNYYVSLGTNEEDINVLGIPLYDRLYKKFSNLEDPKKIRNNINKQFSIDQREKIILLLTTHYEDFIREKAFRSVVEVNNKLNNFKLIVKLHPIEEISYYKKLAIKYHAKDIHIIKDFDLYNLILASDIIIGRSTGAEIEAIFLDKKVIDLSYESKLDVFQIHEFEAALPVYNPADLETTINKAINEIKISESLKKGREKFKNYCVKEFDGKASVRIKKLIEKILNS